MDLFESLKLEGNEEKAVAMSAYMKGKFPFLGIQAPDRRNICKPYFKEMKKLPEVDWEFVDRCYQEEAREFQIVAIDYLSFMRNKIREDDIERIEELITTKSWWDSVDSLSSIIGILILKYPILKNKIGEWGFKSDNIWLIRTAIIHQLKFKGETDRDFLGDVIIHNSGTKEFFINKAIGWALREYSKTNKQWVKQFLDQHQLSNLSVREASKYLL